MGLRNRRTLWIVLLALGAFLLSAVIAFRFVGEPLRRRMEATMNAELKGYHVRIEALDLDILNFALALEDLIVTQDAHPKPPVARIDAMNLSVDWRALLRGHVLGDVELKRPALHIDLTHLRKEVQDNVPVEEKGWQEAVEATWLTINRFSVTNGKLTYVDSDREHPVRLSGIYFATDNIRIVRDQKEEYPSDLWMEATVFDKGRVRVVGRVNYLSEPFPAVKVDVQMKQIELRHLKPVAIHADLELNRGVLSAAGAIEYGPRHRDLQLASLDVDAVDVKYIRRAGADREQEVRLAKVEDVADSLTKPPETRVRIDGVAIKDSTFGFVDQDTKPNYVAYFSDTSFTLRDFTNAKTRTPARVHLEALFMGSGRTLIDGSFRTDQTPPEFHVALRIEDTDLPALNDALRAYGDLDVVRGKLSLYSDITAEGGEIKGYVKPLFNDMEVYARRQDRTDTILHQLYEGAAGGIAGLLRNRREDVATIADISGSISDPHVSTWKIIIRLVRNAFIEAILPGLEPTEHDGGAPS